MRHQLLSVAVVSKCDPVSLISHVFLSCSTAPERLNPELNIDENDPEEITIRWTPSSSVLRYILEVRQFVADGPGKEKVKTIDDYPRELAGIELEHTVTDLSEILRFHSLLQLPSPHSLSVVGETPYQYTLVAGNTQGCGRIFSSSTFFTKEGSKLTRE